MFREQKMHLICCREISLKIEVRECSGNILGTETAVKIQWCFVRGIRFKSLVILQCNHNVHGTIYLKQFQSVHRQKIQSKSSNKKM